MKTMYMNSLSSSGFSEVTAKNATSAGMDKRKSSAAPLAASQGPQLSDVIINKWENSWFLAVLGAIIQTEPNTVSALWKKPHEQKRGDTDSPDFWELPREEATFQLTDYTGNKIEKTGKFKDINKDADYYGDPGYWFLAGLETAALQMEGYMGLDLKHFSWGSPADAFMMLTGKLATVEYIDSEDQLAKWVSKSSSTPVVFGTLDKTTNWKLFNDNRWYTGLGNAKEGRVSYRDIQHNMNKDCSLKDAKKNFWMVAHYDDETI
ncbi:uncharacterized protein IL334_005346 [Kwoniella shivajii]|uniref:Uncharacterized protein n=1 Tax=Kwoniella shivajii TaxID=564305 RepID=A0ABZ1D3A5_9TREE|nr:hypothetical protein IL334_005346 [Kwoniella shivajii]